MTADETRVAHEPDGPPPALSIGMPVYNGERYLADALDALLGQTFADFELIISDNGSTDGTEEICRDHARRDSRIRYERQSVNRGVAWNFNRVFHLSRAEFFKWAAVDDLCQPQFLARCLDVLRDDPSVVCCHARTCKIDADGRRLTDLDDPTDGGLPSRWFAGPRPRVDRPDASSPVPHRRFRDVLLSSGWAVRSSGVVRAAALRQTTLLQPYYGYEKVMMAELALRGRFHDVEEVLFFQRVHERAASAIGSAAAQQRFFAPLQPSRRGAVRLPLLRGYWRAVSTAPIDRWQRLRCRQWIGRYLFQLNKWYPLLYSKLFGLAMGRGTASRRAAPVTAPAEIEAVVDESSVYGSPVSNTHEAR